ncbi:hypothetical protein GMORB2_4698 [Geosmithia morbida]|uniref:Uncharacterized protein n=1 Tax=Geosmithia morbida TaxID=1094350 RepID=A0A9P5CXR2_9HYPO|nr:uncharacterized protein GMORB2_4698 [Geosmithia morbida]KAF4119568.1 hypothetical protein GMORB2_4698 [Geosmithia morbida]
MESQSMLLSLSTPGVPNLPASETSSSPPIPAEIDTHIAPSATSGQAVIPTSQCFASPPGNTTQPYVPPILSSLFPGGSADYDLNLEPESTEFLSAMIRNGSIAAFDHEQAIAAWFDN